MTTTTHRVSTPQANPFARHATSPAQLEVNRPPSTPRIEGLRSPLRVDNGETHFISGDWTSKGIAVVGLHGGAGTSTLAEILAVDECPPGIGPAVLPQTCKALIFCAEHSVHGAKCALQAARHWSAGLDNNAEVKGIVLIKRLRGKDSEIPRRVLKVLRTLWPAMIVVPHTNNPTTPSKKITTQLESLKGTQE